MKKAVKGLIVAASVAAVVGVAGVSFAKWEQGSATGTVTGNTGTIVVFGSISVVDTLDSKLLVPYDQVDQWDPATMTKGFTVTPTYTAGTGSAVIKMVVTGDAASRIKYEDDGQWKTFTSAVTVTSGTTYNIRLESEQENQSTDMGKSFTITFTAETA